MFRLDPDSGEVFLASQDSLKQLLKRERLLEKIYLRIRAKDAKSHITESQLVIHLLEQTLDNPPVIRGLAIINTKYVELQKQGKKL